MLRSLSLTGACAASLAAGCAPIGVEAAAAKTEAYQYELTQKSAYDCGTVQLVLSNLKSESDPEWARYHEAMSFTWYVVVGLLDDVPLSQTEADALTDATIAKLPDDETLQEAATELAKSCEVMTKLYYPEYSAAALAAKEEKADLFAGDAAFKRQIGGEYPDAPTKELTFGDWTFFARGNLCVGAFQFEDDARLMFRFTNFNDGSISFEWDGLPELDAESDAYQDEFAKHRIGITFDDDVNTIFADGVTYESFPGTAVFVDDEPLAALSDGQTNGQDYRFGAGVQGTYYTRLPLARELSIKVLGRETHRLRIDNAAFWNEMSRCVAQYPFG